LPPPPPPRAAPAHVAEEGLIQVPDHPSLGPIVEGAAAPPGARGREAVGRWGPSRPPAPPCRRRCAGRAAWPSQLRPARGVRAPRCPAPRALLPPPNMTHRLPPPPATPAGGLGRYRPVKVSWIYRQEAGGRAWRSPLREAALGAIRSAAPGPGARQRGAPACPAAAARAVAMPASQ
jgi:hypothetical protein